jgi:AraC-like DNA-binding protein
MEQPPYFEPLFSDWMGNSFPPYITLAHLFHAPVGWGILNRRLKEYALQYVVEGEAEYEIEGIVYLTKTGDIIIHRPNEIHTLRMKPGKPYICISLVFHMGDAKFPLEPSLQMHHYCGNYKDQLTEKLLSELIVSYRKRGLEHQLKCKSLFLHILSEIEAQINLHSAKIDTGKKLNRMVLVKNAIVKNFDQALDYALLEQIAGITKNHLIASFKITFGIAPGQFQIMLRVQKAKELAIHTGLSVGEIANQVGYNDVHTFGKIFKKKTGYSLTQYCSSLVAKLK